MQRNLHRLSEDVFDLCVVGGGIYGVCVAWDAALRGLSVALIEKGDFGHATSSNSQKVIHGGLRYLQSADLARMRESSRERMVWMRIAPHLVHRIPFLIPIYRNSDKPKGLISLGLKAYDFVSSSDRNRLEDPEKFIPRGRVLSRQECMELFPEAEADDLTGAIVFYDGQMHSSERLLLSVAKSAANAGVAVTNYVEAVDFITDGKRVTGVRAKDVLRGDEFEVRARTVVNTVGPWVNQVFDRLGDHGASTAVPMCKAMNLIVKRPPSEYAVGLRSKAGRLLFATPWHDLMLIGTAQLPYEGDVDEFRISEEDIQSFVDEVNGCRPNLSIHREDVVFHHGGLVPADQKQYARGAIELAAHGRIVDHAKDAGVDGLITVIGVKYTTARSTAEKVVGLVFDKLGRKAVGSRSAETPLHGSPVGRFDDFLARSVSQNRHGLGEETVRHLALNYGSAFPDVLECADDLPDGAERVGEGSEVISAEIIHGIRNEMAQKLGDVVFRRTELGAKGDPGDESICAAADIMASEMGWSKSRTELEIDAVREVFSRGVVYA